MLSFQKPSFFPEMKNGTDLYNWTSTAEKIWSLEALTRERQIPEPVQVAEENPSKYQHNKLAYFLYSYTQKFQMSQKHNKQRDQ